MTGRPRLPPEQLTPCPSDAAYKRHLLRGEAACDGCKAAHAAYNAQRAAARQRRKARR